MRSSFWVFAILITSSAWAADSQSPLSVSAGIASPSVTSALGENPAGIAKNRGKSLLFDTRSESDDFEPRGYGAAFFAGNGDAGAALGISSSRGLPGSTSSGTALDFGIAAEAGPFAFGLAGAFGQDLTVNAGLILGTSGSLHAGATAYGVNDGVDGFGAGVSSQFSSSALVAVDAGTDADFDAMTIKPGLRISANNLHLSFSYGIKIKDGGTPVRRDGSFGVAYEFSPKWGARFYYNQLAKFYLGLEVRL